MLRKNLIQKKLKRRFVVTHVSGEVFSGVLISSDREYHVFADVKVHQEHAVAKSAPGETYIERVKVDYLQLVTDASG